MKGVTLRSKAHDFACLKAHEYNFAIVRGQTNIGLRDPSALSNIEGAKGAGMQFVDVYMNPCVDCPEVPEKQMQAFIDNFKSLGVRKIWVSVQQTEKWKKDKTFNCQYLQALLTEAMRLNQTIGVATNIRDWTRIMNPACELLNPKVDCWWLMHDSKADTTTYEEFGYIKRPEIKEYLGPIHECDTDLNVNIFLDSAPSPRKTDL